MKVQAHSDQIESRCCSYAGWLTRKNQFYHLHLYHFHGNMLLVVTYAVHQTLNTTNRLYFDQSIFLEMGSLFMDDPWAWCADCEIFTPVLKGPFLCSFKFLFLSAFSISFCIPILSQSRLIKMSPIQLKEYKTKSVKHTTSEFIQRKQHRCWQLVVEQLLLEVLIPYWRNDTF